MPTPPLSIHCPKRTSSLHSPPLPNLGLVAGLRRSNQDFELQGLLKLIAGSHNIKIFGLQREVVGFQQMLSQFPHLDGFHGLPSAARLWPAQPVILTAVVF
jgi:hypothetical protein